MAPVRLKTVYDATRSDPFGLFAAQLRLHVASWRANVPSAAGLTVTCIGDPPQDLADFLHATGADLEVKPGPHRLAARSAIYNKHLAAPRDDSERVFLADNDTVYLTDIDQLLDVPERCVAASLGDRRRVTPELWEQLRIEANVKVLPMDWIPWRERGFAEVEQRAPEWERYVYFNGGAILFPPGGEFWALWESETERLSAYLAGRGLDDRKDAGSDQLSLTSAAAIHGAWQLLPAGYNVRPFHFWIPGVDVDEVAQLHMVASRKGLRRTPAGERGSLTAVLRSYWEAMIFGDVTPDKQPLAEALLDQAVALVKDFDLDEMRAEQVT